MATDPGEALLEALERAASRLREALAPALRLGEQLLREAFERGLLHPLEPRPPSSTVYAVDGGAARAVLGAGLAAVLHAAAVEYEPQQGAIVGERHLASVVTVPGLGPEALEAIETAMIALETLLASSLPANGLLVLDGPLADPPWVPRATELLGAVAGQLASDHGAEAVETVHRIHEMRRRLFTGRSSVGVVKRLTGSLVLQALAPREEAAVVGDDPAARGMLAALRRRGEQRPHCVGPVPLGGGVYQAYPGLHTCLVLDPRGPGFYRVEALGARACVEAAEALAGLTPPGARLPLPVMLAHHAARAPRRLLPVLVRRALAGLAGEELDPAALEQLLGLTPGGGGGAGTP